MSQVKTLDGVSGQGGNLDSLLSLFQPIFYQQTKCQQHDINATLFSLTITILVMTAEREISPFMEAAEERRIKEATETKVSELLLLARRTLLMVFHCTVREIFDQ